MLNNKRHKMTKDIDVRVKYDCEETLDKCKEQFRLGNVLNTDEELIKIDLKYLDEKFKAYSKPKLLQLKFQKFIRTQKVTDQFVSSLVGRDEHLKLMYGNGWDGRTRFRG